MHFNLTLGTAEDHNAWLNVFVMIMLVYVILEFHVEHQHLNVKNDMI